MESIFYRNFVYEKWYYLLDVIIFIAIITSVDQMIFKTDEIPIFTWAFVGLVSVHCISNANYINKQSSQIFYNSLPVSKVDIVKGHYLYNLLLTVISVIAIICIGLIQQNMLFVQIALFIMTTNFLPLSIAYRHHAQVESSQMGAWIVYIIVAVIAMFYVPIYINIPEEALEKFEWLIFVHYMPLTLAIVSVIIWIVSFATALKKAKHDKITIYGGVK